MEKKVIIPVRPPLREYLRKHRLEVKLPLQYEDLDRFSQSVDLLNYTGEPTLWQTIYYDEYERDFVMKGLCQIYALLNMGGDYSALEHLEVARIDYCLFGNTRPFRVRIINRLNDNYDHFYVKKSDANRIYGLELEELLSPEKVRYLVDGTTLIEEHIAGIPGDDFFATKLDDIPFNQVRMAKEFVKFNERCFVRLLGDMRAYNYVIDITPDIEGSQFRFRAIDFDQQCYEGRKSFYLPQFFKENNPIVFLGIELMDAKAVRQYQLEERALIGTRIKVGNRRVRDLLKIISEDEISTPEKTRQLREELNEHHGTHRFSKCKRMGEVLQAHLRLALEKEFHQSLG
ncbi:hypothetical protein QWY85_13875 [Neolewinella lacunae]|uniref:Uncharacterized protein n=1 Tax=Neolewinella lacunae TaxID=1517758 RepID=A0A923PNF2_9BACT|nr:hypothetical protein [Neolewinella lacunae]MBC6993727.1 hypothetical protein [Neolewinella lacunae]MDN3635753.1 hypothetical protein [Neolewinella lacunae]